MEEEVKETVEKGDNGQKDLRRAEESGGCHMQWQQDSLHRSRDFSFTVTGENEDGRGATAGKPEGVEPGVVQDPGQQFEFPL